MWFLYPGLGWPRLPKIHQEYNIHLEQVNKQRALRLKPAYAYGADLIMNEKGAKAAKVSLGSLRDAQRARLCSGLVVESRVAA